jgi:hypothetical protein
MVLLLREGDEWPLGHATDAGAALAGTPGRHRHQARIRPQRPLLKSLIGAAPADAP